MRIVNVVGARPNFVKIAPVVEAMRGHGGLEQLLVHTGQHYDRRMSDLFFDDLGLPSPDVNLGVGPGSAAIQTARIMVAFEEVCLRERPDLVLVVGDVTSTIACALVAVKLGIRVAHVEAGLRSFERAMPEEINRVLTDAVAHLLFTTEESANANLAREGIDRSRVRFVGNVMIDTLLRHREKARMSRILPELGLVDGGAPAPYGVLTLHRPGTVDDGAVLRRLLEALTEAARDMPLVFPVHPRTRTRIRDNGLERLLGTVDAGRPGIHLVDPLGYLDFIQLMAEAAVVLTDSGGIQEETTALGVPCVTLRDTTERPVTVTHGTNVLAGTDPLRVLAAFHSQRDRGRRVPVLPPLWDGKAALRVVDAIAESFAAGVAA